MSVTWIATADRVLMTGLGTIVNLFKRKITLGFLIFLFVKKWPEAKIMCAWIDADFVHNMIVPVRLPLVSQTEGVLEIDEEILYHNTQEVKYEHFLIWTRQNNDQIFGVCCLLQSDKRIDRCKTRKLS